ncbi:MAG: HK97 gp10 family phage protein [Candidatus Eisenbacteria bacterium]|nr:HK97 gp10 family phage protein [Candidatus Eisenbacteria bacterium]
MAAAITILRAAVVPKTPNAFGFLRNSIQGSVIELGSEGAIIGRLESALQYAQYVEEGTRPRREIGASPPPVGPITLWARRKLQLTGDELDRAVFLIRMKIYNKGTKGARMFELGWKQEEARVESLFDRALDKIVDAIEREMF